MAEFTDQGDDDNDNDDNDNDDDNDDNDTHLELLGVVVVVSQVPFSNTNCELPGQETVTNVI